MRKLKQRTVDFHMFSFSISSSSVTFIKTFSLLLFVRSSILIPLSLLCIYVFLFLFFSYGHIPSHLQKITSWYSYILQPADGQAYRDTLEPLLTNIVSLTLSKGICECICIYSYTVLAYTV